MTEKDELGRAGERIAAEWLSAHGWQVVDRNWRCRRGEIDLVIARGGTVAIVEVKTRRGMGYGHPFEAITALKLARLNRLAAAWLEDARGRVDGGAAALAVRDCREVRVDAVSVLAPREAPAVVEHLEGVVA